MTHENPRYVKRRIEWDGENISDVLAFFQGDERGPVYLNGYANRDELVGVWTPTGLSVAKIGDTILHDEKDQFWVEWKEHRGAR